MSFMSLSAQAYIESGQKLERKAIVEFLDQWNNGETQTLSIEQVIDLIERGEYIE